MSARAAKIAHGPQRPPESAWWLATYGPKIAEIGHVCSPAAHIEIANELGDVTPGLVSAYCLTHRPRLPAPVRLAIVALVQTEARPAQDDEIPRNARTLASLATAHEWAAAITYSRGGGADCIAVRLRRDSIPLAGIFFDGRWAYGVGRFEHYPTATAFKQRLEMPR